MKDQFFIERAIEIAIESVKKGGKPFSCLIVKDDKILVEAVNEQTITKSPIDHAEIVAINKATEMGIDPTGATFYTIPDACPMCLAAMIYCDPKEIIFCVTREEVASVYQEKYEHMPDYIDFSKEVAKPWNERHVPTKFIPNERGTAPHKLWKKLNPGKMWGEKTSEDQGMEEKSSAKLGAKSSEAVSFFAVQSESTEKTTENETMPMESPKGEI